MRTLVAALLLCFSIHGEDWQAAFAKIPIHTTKFPAHLTPPVELILTNFQPTAEFRAVVLMPGAADRLYFYDWGQVTLRENPTLLDAITALTNQASLPADSAFNIICQKSAERGVENQYYSRVVVYSKQQ